MDSYPELTSGRYAYRLDNLAAKVNKLSTVIFQSEFSEIPYLMLKFSA